MADPGFPVGGGGVDSLGERGPPTWVLFGKNVCKNERIWSHRGGRAGRTLPLDPPMIWFINMAFHKFKNMDLVEQVHIFGLLNFHTNGSNISLIRLFSLISIMQNHEFFSILGSFGHYY